MKKIPTLYVRDQQTRQVDPTKVTPGCEWVTAGKGIPTRKYDGTCVMLDEHGCWWSRRTVKPGKQPPHCYQPIETDPITGKTVGWEPIERSPFRQPWRDAADVMCSVLSVLGREPKPGTFELVGPKINGNPEGYRRHVLLRHASAEAISLISSGTTPTELIELCREWGWEGIVWHHPDGRMAKLKVKDLPAPATTSNN